MTKRLPASATFEQRFWHRVQRGEGCWVWTGYRAKDGYGRIKAPGENKPILVHRASWELANGPIEDGLFVCHHCDNPPCVRLDHLFLGTAADNTADMIGKGRHRTHGPLRLRPEHVEAIISRYRPGTGPCGRGANTAALAEEFGISGEHVLYLVRQARRLVAGAK